MENAYDSKW
jgi:hypothetical protein